jgi:hypothetical protein
MSEEKTTISTGTLVMIGIVIIAAFGAYHTFSKKTSAPPPMSKAEKVANTVGLVIRERINNAHPGDVAAVNTASGELTPSEDDDGFYAVPGETTYHRGWCPSIGLLKNMARITPVQAATMTAAGDCRRDATPYPLPNAMTEPQRVCEACDHDPRGFAQLSGAKRHVYVDRRTGYFHLANCKYVGPALDDGGTPRLALEAGYHPDPDCIGPLLR